MKIAIPLGDRNGLKGRVAEHFGRAEIFLIYDTETQTVDVLPNPEAEGKKESPPDFLKRRGVGEVIVSGLGSMAREKFKNHNIRIYKAADDTVEENIRKFRKGKLTDLCKDETS